MNMIQIFRLAGVLVCASALSACFDIETTVSISQEREVEMIAVMRIDRSVYDMMPVTERNGFCPPDKVTIEQHVATCNIAGTTQVPAGGNVILGNDPATSLRAQHVKSESLVRITLPLQAMLADVKGGLPSAPADGPVSSEDIATMQRAAMSGKSLTFRVKGDRVVASNGRLNGEQTEAIWIFPLVDVIDGNYRAEDGFTDIAVQPTD